MAWNRTGKKTLINFAPFSSFYTYIIWVWHHDFNFNDVMFQKQKYSNSGNRVKSLQRNGTKCIQITVDKYNEALPVSTASNSYNRNANIGSPATSSLKCKPLVKSLSEGSVTHRTKRCTSRN